MLPSLVFFGVSRHPQHTKWNDYYTKSLGTSSFCSTQVVRQLRTRFQCWINCVLHHLPPEMAEYQNMDTPNTMEQGTKPVVLRLQKNLRILGASFLFDLQELVLELERINQTCRDPYVFRPNRLIFDGRGPITNGNNIRITTRLLRGKWLEH